MAQVEQPIGIFDSGVGGLCIARSVVDALPYENIVYFGDTAHLPYGEKSAAAIQSYSLKIAQLLLEQNCKLILIACSSASTAAYDVVKEYVGNKAIVLNVIDPVVEHIRQHQIGKRLGLIGTKQTVNSNIYQKKIDDLNLKIQLKQHATPLLAAAIEENFKNERILDELLNEYLSHPNLEAIEGLILGCTHYPIVKHRIHKFFEHKINIIDVSELIPTTVVEQLKEQKLLNTNKTLGEKLFYVSDYTQSFEARARLFFNESIKLQHYPLWE